MPDGVVLHYASVPNRDRAWAGPVPITSLRRMLADCAKERISPELLREAAMQALRRGVVTRADVREVAAALEPSGNWPPDPEIFPVLPLDCYGDARTPETDDAG